MSVNLFIARSLFSFETILKLQDGEITLISSPFLILLVAPNSPLEMKEYLDLKNILTYEIK